MTSSELAVVVEQLPETCDTSFSRTFLRRIQTEIAERVRPAVVLDCSQVRRIDKALVHLLFSCLEEAMKRNGDVRLAGVRAEAWPGLEAAGVGRLFRVYSTSAEAASSYRRPSVARVTTMPSRPAPAANAA